MGDYLIEYSIRRDPRGRCVEGTAYRVMKHLASGAFGSVYTGKHDQTGEQVAIKLESANIRNPTLHFEYLFYEKVGEHEQLPRIRAFGKVPPSWSGLVMEMLGPHLEEMRERCGGRLSQATTIQLAIQFLHLFEFVHDRGYLYRDVKPQNFLLGRPRTDKYHVVHLVDPGMCKKYLNDAGQHIPARTGKPSLGTPRYMSIPNHRGHELGRRDDLESVAYMLIYLARGTLPWQSATTYAAIATAKEETPIVRLCDDLPRVFASFLRAARACDFDARPDYRSLRARFTATLAADFQRIMRQQQTYDWDSDHKPRRCGGGGG